MAKDAKGHGSEKRGGGLSVPDQHALRIARQTLNMPDAMVGVMGGPNKQQAQAIMDRQAASELGQGHPKSDTVPVHSGASGGLARGLSVDWTKAPNPHSGGGFAAQSRARRKDKAAAYVAARAARLSNFKLK